MGGGKGSSPPPPPDPNKTGQAQTATNVSTAIANAWLRNPWQVTPYGDLMFAERGQYVWFDPLDKNKARPLAEQEFNEWYKAHRPPPLPDPSLAGKNPAAYKAAVQRYQDWFDQRNAVLREIAAKYKVNIYSVPLLQAHQALSPEQQVVWNNMIAANQNLSKLAAEQTDWLREYLGDHKVDLSDIPERKYFDFRKPDLERVSGTPEYAHLFQGDRAPDFRDERRRVENAIMNRLDERFKEEEDRLRARLAAQGIQPGSQAWQDAMDDLNRKWNDARMQAIAIGGQEMERQARLQMAYTQAENAIRGTSFNDLLRKAAFNNQVSAQDLADALRIMQAQEQQRAGALQEKFAIRGQPIQEVVSLLHGTAIQNPRFVAPQIDSMPTVDYAGLVNENYRQRLAAWQAEQAASAQMWGSVLGFMGSLFGALSDPREKKNVTRTGRRAPGGVEYVAYRYKGEPASAPKRLGVLAHEVERKRPDAVIEMPRRGRQRKGLRYVDYARLGAGR